MIIKSEETKEDHQRKMYGMTEAELFAEWKMSLVDDPSFYAFCILSDAQELMAMGELEASNRLINKAKFWIRNGIKFAEDAAAKANGNIILRPAEEN